MLRVFFACIVTVASPLNSESFYFGILLAPYQQNADSTVLIILIITTGDSAFVSVNLYSAKIHDVIANVRRAGFCESASLIRVSRVV